MNRLQNALKSAVALTLLLSAVKAPAQTTGSIQGRVTDEQGAGLPRATVETKSPALQGSRLAATDDAGRYRLEVLPPGVYTLTISMPGFQKVEQRGLTVGLGKATSFDATLKIAVSAEVVVSGEAPVVDTTSTTAGVNLDSRQVETLPTGRNYSSIAQVVPGVSTDASNNNSEQSTITIYGSSGAENSFYIDGVNTTGAEYGFQGKELNYEFIQAVEVKTGGYEAEFGRSTGGIINVVTKSGGNEFHGDVFAYYDNDSLQDDAEKVVSTAGTTAGFTRKDFGLDLGGYFLKDKLWFFGAYDRVENIQNSILPAGPDAGKTVSSNSDRDLASGKLTFKLTPSQSIIGTFFQDPRDDTGAVVDGDHTLNGDPITYRGLRSFGGEDFALRYEGLFGSRWLGTLQASRHKEENSVGPETSAGDAIEYRDLDNNGFQTGGFGLIQNKSFKRDAFLLAITHFLGGQELKLGFEYEQEDADVIKRMSGGQRVDILANPVNPSKPVYSHFYWTTPNATVANAPTSQLQASPRHKVTTAYLQDRWAVLPNLSVNAGVRWDRQQIIDASGVTQIDMKNDFAPRFGVIWDPTNDGKSKVYGSYGRYYEQLTMDLVIRSFSYERQPRIYNYSRTSTTPDAAAERDIDSNSAILGGFTEPSDPDLRNQFLHEGILGFEREVMPNLALGIKGVYRKYGEVIEDFLCQDDGTYCIGNPGKGIMQRIYTLDYSQTFPAPEAKREYKAIQIDATKRFANSWYAQASYIYSKLDGNFDGLFAPFTNVGADPNISAAFDYYDFFTNGRDLNKITNNGPLSNDRRHQFKLSGVWQHSSGLSIGASAYYQTGTPLTRYGYSDAYGRYEFFLTERGAEGRGPDSYEADLHFGYPVRVGPVSINILLDVFHILNSQRPLLLDQRWGFQEADNELAHPANPDYLAPVIRTQPTSLRLGLRVSY